MAPTALRQLARAMAQQKVRVRQRPDVFRVFAAAAVTQYDAFLEVVARLGEIHGIRVRPRHLDLPPADLGPPTWTRPWMAEIRSRSEPEAALAAELLAYLTPGGLIPEPDARLAQELGADPGDIAAARSFLIRHLQIGYRTVIDYWRHRRGDRLTPVEHQMLTILAGLLADPDAAEPHQIRAEVERRGLSFPHLQQLGRRLVRDLGYGPLAGDAPVPYTRPRSVDLVLYRDNDRLAYVPNIPSVQVLPADTAVATITVDPEVRQDVLDLIRRSLATRARALKTLAELVLEYNGAYLLGHRPYRRNVPHRVLRQRYPGDPKAIYGLQARFEDRRFAMYELLGYDRHPASGYILHVPLRDILALRRRFAPRTAVELHRILKDYGIHISRSTLYRLLREVDRGPTRSV